MLLGGDQLLLYKVLKFKIFIYFSGLKPINFSIPNYDQIQLLKETRKSNTDKDCNCYICQTGRSKCHSKLERGSTKLSASITIENGLLAASKPKVPKVKSNNKVTSNTIKICAHCKNKVSVGINHPCNKSENVANVLKIIDTLPKKQQDQIIYSKLKDSIGNRSGETALTTRGSKATVTLNPPEEKKPFYSKECLDNFQEHTGTSSNFMKKMTNFIRVGAGKKAIPSHYRDHASKKAKQLKDIYHTSSTIMDIGEGEKGNRPII